PLRRWRVARHLANHARHGGRLSGGAGVGGSARGRLSDRRERGGGVAGLRTVARGCGRPHPCEAGLRSERIRRHPVPSRADRRVIRPILISSLAGLITLLLLTICDDLMSYLINSNYYQVRGHPEQTDAAKAADEPVE